VFEQRVGPHILEDPTADEVLAALRPNVEIAHLSCHGHYDSVNPLTSALHLATPLQLRSLLGRNGAPWLVNLSACQTGMADSPASEQMISFPTTFLVGGASHVLATLWPVGNDQATALNDAFYDELTDGAHPAEALRRAVQSLRGNRSRSQPLHDAAHPDHDPGRDDLPLDPTHEFWWAPFTHYGSPW
jgi:CHAT domain-containing protein